MMEDDVTDISSSGPSDQGEVLSVPTRMADISPAMVPNGIFGPDSVYPDACVHSLFEDQVTRSRNAVAVQYLDQSMTYGELNSRADCIASHLKSLGLRPGELVGVCMPRCPDLVAALLAVWKAGAAYVPLDPSYPRERLLFMVEDSGVSCVLTVTSNAHFFEDRVSAVVLDSERLDIAAEVTSSSSPSALAYVMYTSGSTGKPKGATITHSGLVNYLCWAIDAYNVRPACIVPVHSSIAFDLTVTSLYPALLAGGTVDLLPESESGLELIKAMRLNKRYALVKITPAHLEMVTQDLEAGELAGSTSALVIGGENLRAEILDKWRDFAPGTRIFNEYGPTETVVGCCVHEVTSLDPRQGSVSIGRPISNTQLYVLDSSMSPVPSGHIGELYIGGDGVANGYLNRVELTADRFLPDSFTSRPTAKLYKTGDLVKAGEDGTLLYLGRIDHQVKIRGFRIELGEIEQTMTEHPSVQSCVVLADNSNNLPCLIAYVIAHDSSMTTQILSDFVAARLPEHMIPQRIIFVPQFQLTNNGKVDRDALLALARSSSDLSRDTAPALSHSEAILSRIWRDLLRRDHIEIRDDIFSLGAYSLLIARAVTTIRTEFKVDLQLRDIFENPTIAGQSELVEKLLWSTRANSPSVPQNGREEIEI